MANAGYVAKVFRDWDIPQGADTVNTFRYGTQDGDDPVVYPELVTDGWSARAQIRKKPGADVWVELLSTATTGARIILDDDGYITLVLPAATTEDTAWDRRTRGVYDLELIDPDGFVIRLASGDVEVTHDVTRMETPA